jgi:hypothetical protein
MQHTGMAMLRMPCIKLAVCCDRLRNCLVQHVPNAREQPEDAVLSLRVESAELFDVDDTILRARPESRLALSNADSGAVK